MSSKRPASKELSPRPPSFDRDNDPDEEDDDRKPPAVIKTPRNRDDDESNEEENSLDTAMSSTAQGSDSMSDEKKTNNQARNDSAPSEAWAEARPITEMTVFANNIPASPNSTMSTSTMAQKNRSTQIERSMVHSEMMLLAGTAALSMATFIYAVLPTAALVALASLLASLSIMGTSTVRRLVQIEIQWLRETDGLRRILPAAWYNFLTERSLHDQLNSDDSTAHEYMYLVLYFLPLPRELLYYYLNRLNPQHLEELHRRGLGHFFLPSTTMQLIMGQEGFAQATQQQDEDRQLLRASQHETEEQAARLSRSVLVARNAENDNNNNNNEEDEYDDSVLFNAMWDSFYLSVYAPTVAWASSFMTDRLWRPTTRRMIRYGGGLSLLTAGLGLGNYYRRGSGRSWAHFRATALNQRQDQFLYMTAAVSGVCFFMALGFQQYLDSIQPNDTTNDAKDSDGKKKKKNKKN